MLGYSRKQESCFCFKHIFFLISILIVGIRDLFGAVRGVLCEAIKPGLLIWLQPNWNLGVRCCSGAIHVLWLRTSIKALVDQIVLHIVHRLFCILPDFRLFCAGIISSYLFSLLSGMVGQTCCRNPVWYWIANSSTVFLLESGLLSSSQPSVEISFKAWKSSYNLN